MNMPTPKTIEKYVEEFREKFAARKVGLDRFDDSLRFEEVIDFLTTALIDAHAKGVEEGRNEILSSILNILASKSPDGEPYSGLDKVLSIESFLRNPEIDSARTSTSE